MIGILGGMGPVATADFFNKLLEETPAQCDEDHVPVLIQSDPRIPHRPPAILSGGESPLPALRQSRDRLIAAGATALAMPCNTAHYWYAQLAADCPVPFLSIVDASCDQLAALAPSGSAVGVISTRATAVGRVFDAALLARGHTPMYPTDGEMDAVILPAIALVKAGQAARAGQLLAPAVQALLARGAVAVILACTETPMALDAVASPLRAHCIDTNRALARACVRLWAQLRSQALTS
ncbi:aspartate/glutamate racemase family protein [Piscinibacter sp.]|jgi:aspartate racemase|uniref:aspartate/glutamate racemase family protein n=1 Tax=Piscinibacter sp. TaxID=1903157 RepID=UPI00355A5C9E